MKFSVLALLALACAVLATDEIDWSKVRPMSRMPQYWRRLPKDILKQYLSEVRSLPASVRGNSRIVNGYIAAPGQFPYQIALLSNQATGGAGLCGGSVLSANYILTAAHCVDTGTIGGLVIYGAEDRTNANEPNQVRIAFEQSGIRLHPNWNPALIRYDIATVRVVSPVTFSARIQPVTLPRLSDVGNDFAGLIGTVSGFGRFSDSVPEASTVLRYVNNPIQTNLACSLRFPGVVQPENICLSGDAGRGACQGDSGGPLTIQRDGTTVQLGVVSFGLALGCELNWPSVFARTTSFLTWIAENSDVTLLP
ncbi:AGAP007252-PA-like protein [Anopheles sinensis]|uniref:AGAP007252-PA-like protein n=1 Tax=Anopheles sinensis TaxID=74873 RepID=A0A084VQV7_ANOSI|nr:AGAP007252-PA-like protein [Anopheles sinensis]